MYLFSMFHVEGLNYIRTSLYTNSMDLVPDPVVQTEKFGVRAPVVLVGSEELKSGRKVDLRRFVTESVEDVSDEPRYTGPDGLKYLRRIQTDRLVVGSLVVFYAQRKYLSETGSVERSYSDVVAPKILNLEFMGDESLGLDSVIVHRSSHYTCYIRCGSDSWYYYNDIRGDAVYVGGYDDMIRQKDYPNPFSEGVLYFYKN